MVIIENIIIIAIVGLAIGYLIKLVWNQFIGQSGGCASCDSAGACGVHIPDVKKIEES